MKIVSEQSSNGVTITHMKFDSMLEMAEFFENEEGRIQAAALAYELTGSAHNLKEA